jgi:hypothetical protein
MTIGSEWRAIKAWAIDKSDTRLEAGVGTLNKAKRSRMAFLLVAQN